MTAITIQFSRPQYEMIGSIKSSTITIWFYFDLGSPRPDHALAYLDQPVRGNRGIKESRGQE